MTNTYKRKTLSNIIGRLSILASSTSLGSKVKEYLKRKSLEKEISNSQLEINKIDKKLDEIDKEVAEYKVAISLNSAKKYGDCLHLDEAIKEYETALKIQRENFGDNSQTAVILNDLASVCRQKGNIENAISLYKEGHIILSKYLGEKDPSTKTIYNNMNAAIAEQKSSL
jgi:tetratricopeptide (TPR) repeat protein